MIIRSVFICIYKNIMLCYNEKGISTRASEFQRIIEAGSSADNTIQQMNWMNGGNQKWRLIPVGAISDDGGLGSRIATLKIKTGYGTGLNPIDYKAYNTVAHEIGHLLWLKDNPPATGFTIMRQADFSIYVPTTYDANNVKWFYGS